MVDIMIVFLLALLIAVLVLLPFTFVASRLFTQRPPSWNEIVRQLTHLQRSQIVNAVNFVRLVLSGALVGVALFGALRGPVGVGAVFGVLAVLFSKLHLGDTKLAKI